MVEALVEGAPHVFLFFLFFSAFATPSLPGGHWEEKVLYQNRPPASVLAQALGFSRAEVIGCEFLRVGAPPHSMDMACMHDYFLGLV